MESMIIIGTGGFAFELAGLLSSLKLELKGFIGPSPERKLPAEWLGDDEVIETLDLNSNILIAIGDPRIRSRLVDTINRKKLQQQTFIYPGSYISPEATIATGSIIYPNVTIHAGVVLGQNALINSNATIGHDTSIGEFSNIGPGSSIGGCCALGNKVYIGIGVSTVENISIADNVIVGAGASVVADIGLSGTYVGVPAKKIQK